MPRYGSGWDDVTGADPRRQGLAEEAIWLGRLVTRLLPGEPEAQGLLALMLHCEARRGARRDAAGALRASDEQDVALWSRPMIEEAEALLRQAGGGETARPLPARGRDPVGTCPARRDGQHGLGGDRAALRRADPSRADRSVRRWGMRPRWRKPGGRIRPSSPRGTRSRSRCRLSALLGARAPIFSSASGGWVRLGRPMYGRRG